MNRTSVIKKAIYEYLDAGMTKDEIYNRIVDSLGVPRPTVRRVARDVRQDLMKKIRVLQTDSATTTIMKRTQI